MVNALINFPSTSLPVSYPTGKLNIHLNQPITIQQFTAIQQANLFKNLKDTQFSGQIIFSDKQGIESILYVFLGRIVFATGGVHSVRRWSRNLTLHCPDIACDLTELRQDLQLALASRGEIGWQYQLLSLWIKQQKINREQVSRLIRGILCEVLFDLTYSQEVTYQLKPNRSLPTPLFLINPEEIIVEVWKSWQSWETAKLGTCSPNLAPVIKQSEQLEVQTSPMTYKMLTQRLDGETSLRDLAVYLKQDILQLTRSLLIYVRWGLVELVEIPDLPGPDSPHPQLCSQATQIKSPLVAYVDDSPGMCQRMKQIVNRSGYDFCAIQDGRNAIAICLEQKPDVILVNAKTLDTDGYALCYELRQIPVFRQTPIVMIVPKDTLIDRIRAKMLGISDILDRLSQPEQIISTITKFLEPQVAI